MLSSLRLDKSCHSVPAEEQKIHVKWSDKNTNVKNISLNKYICKSISYFKMVLSKILIYKCYLRAFVWGLKVMLYDYLCFFIFVK